MGDTSGPPPPGRRSPRTLWRLARTLLQASVQQQVVDKRQRLNAARESVMGMVRTGQVVLDASGRRRLKMPASAAAPAAGADANSTGPGEKVHWEDEPPVPITMYVYAQGNGPVGVCPEMGAIMGRGLHSLLADLRMRRDGIATVGS